MGTKYPMSLTMGASDSCPCETKMSAGSLALQLTRSFEQRRLLIGLNPFGNDPQLQRVRHVDDRFDDRAATLAGTRRDAQPGVAHAAQLIELADKDSATSRDSATLNCMEASLAYSPLPPSSS